MKVVDMYRSLWRIERTRGRTYRLKLHTQVLKNCVLPKFFFCISLVINSTLIKRYCKRFMHLQLLVKEEEISYAFER